MNQDDFSDIVELNEEALEGVTGGASAVDNAAAVEMALINSHQVSSADARFAQDKDGHTTVNTSVQYTPNNNPSKATSPNHHKQQRS
jgi:hypothetical protein